MKKLIPILLMIGILFLSGCNPIPKDGYLYIEEDGYYYLVFRDLEPVPPGFPSKDEGACLTFSSVAELKTATENLSKEQIAAMKKLFARDDEKNRIYVCNFDQFYEPIFPDGVINHHAVTWESMHYYISCEFSFDKEAFPHIGITVPGAYYKNLNKFKTMFDHSENYDYLQKEYDAERNADVYTYIDGYNYPGSDHQIPRWRKQVQYTLTKEDKTVCVIEQYVSPDNTDNLETYPSTIVILVSDNGGFLAGSFYWHQEELPSADWLLSFGVKPFVPEEAAAGAIDQSFVSYVQQQNGTLAAYLAYSSENSPDLFYGNDGSIVDIPHMFATLNGYLYDAASIINEIVIAEDIIDDLGGWGVDLRSILPVILYKADDKSDGNDLYNQTFVVVGSAQYSFPWEDICADIDAQNIRELLTVGVSEVITDYYFSNNHHSRFTTFLFGETYDNIKEYVQYIISASILNIVDPRYELDEEGNQTAVKIELTETQIEAIATAFTDFLFEHKRSESI